MTRLPKGAGPQLDLFASAAVTLAADEAPPLHVDPRVDQPPEPEPDPDCNGCIDPEWDAHVDLSPAPETSARLAKIVERAGQYVGFGRAMPWCVRVWASVLDRLAPAGDAPYLEAIEGVDTRALQAAGEGFSVLVSHFIIDGRFADVLGGAYMEFSGRFQRAGLGQFFTPWPVALLLAEMTLGDLDDDRVTLNEPAIGSGVMLLAARGVRASKVGRRRAMRMYMTGQDLDQTCVDMARIQLALSNDRFTTGFFGAALLEQQHAARSLRAAEVTQC